jgi:hypothetical protein
MKSTTLFEAKFMDYTLFLDNSCIFVSAVIAFSSEFDFVVTKPVEFINNLEVMLLVCDFMHINWHILPKNK